MNLLKIALTAPLAAIIVFLDMTMCASAADYIYEHRKLPAGYRGVYYVQGLNNSTVPGGYVDLGLKASDGFGFAMEAVLTCPTPPDRGFCGARTSGRTGIGVSLLRYKKTDSYGWGYAYGKDVDTLVLHGASSYYKAQSELRPGYQSLKIWDDTSALVVDCQPESPVASKPSVTTNLLLFTDNYAYTTAPAIFEAKCYYFKLWQVDEQGKRTLVRDFEPCVRESDGTPGFWDFASLTFVSSCGEKNLLAGAYLPDPPCNRYVSESGDWYRGDDADAPRYTSLLEAVTDSNAGDVIWLEDGFIDEPKDASDHSSEQAGVYVRIKVDKDITIRSVSGDAVTSANPPRLRGRWHNPETGVKAGSKAIRPLWATAGRFEGLVFENGASVDGNADSNGGGAVYGSGGTFVKCVFRNNYAGTGGAIKGRTTCVGCVFTNNFAVGSKGAGGAINCTTGCDLYDCHFAGNGTSDAGAGAIRILAGTDGNPGVISNCTFVGNDGAHQAASGGSAPMGGAIRCETALAYRPTLYDCTFVSNVTIRFGGAYYGPGVFRHCTFSGNYTDPTSSHGYGGAVAGGDDTATNPARTILYDCNVISNKSNGGGNSTLGGGGIYMATAVGTVFLGNYARVKGGAALKSVVVGCEVLKNRLPSGSNSSGAGLSSCVATNCQIVGNYMTGDWSREYQGSGAYNSDLVNCMVVGNIGLGRDGKGGAGLAYTEPGHVCFNTLIADNEDQKGGTGGVAVDATANAPTLVNCTVCGNSSSTKIGGVDKVVLINSIVSGNKGNADSIVAATNSCATILTDMTKYPGCVTDDPKLDARYAPHRKSCRNSALLFDWMTDPNDARSKDVYGAARVQGKGPDMGAVETPDYGLLLMVR